VDVGTGDGRSLLRRARTDGRALFVGIDANAAGIREASRRAARPARTGGAPHALFLVAAAETLPGPLAELADEVTVVLPWGSPLHGMLHADPHLVGALRGLLRDGGWLEALLSVAGADGVPSHPTLNEYSPMRIAEAYRALGLWCAELRPAAAADVERFSSSWARRLGVPGRREGWVATFRRLAEGQ
jgi:16S rRNA (adenine(1408)-N(1))-methyltransferase